jgi:hypothetical protein
VFLCDSDMLTNGITIESKLTAIKIQIYKNNNSISYVFRPPRGSIRLISKIY